MADFEWASIGSLAGAFFLGMLLGAGYFAALWQTLRQLPHSRRPALLLMSSLLLRLALVLTAFYLILKFGQWDRLLTSLLGFILVRMLAAGRLNQRRKATIARSSSETSP